MRRAVKTPNDLRALLRSGFFREFGAALPSRNLRQLRDALLAMISRAQGNRREEEEEEEENPKNATTTLGAGVSVASSASSSTTTSASSREEDADDNNNDDDDDSDADYNNNKEEDNKFREKLEDIIEQLSDVEPRFDFEVSVVARPIVQNLFVGWAGRTWNHVALRIAPEQITPFVYTDPLSVGAVDLIPEVAAAYAQSLKKTTNLTRAEIAERVRSAVNVRFIVSVLFITRQQISVNGGDILRNIFTITL